jgi:hypothetical protein
MNELYLASGSGLLIKRGDVVIEVQARDDQIDIYTSGMRIKEEISSAGFAPGTAKHLVVSKDR